MQIPAEQAGHLRLRGGHARPGLPPLHQDQEGRQLRQPAVQRLPERGTGRGVPGPAGAGPGHGCARSGSRDAAHHPGAVPAGRRHGPSR